MPDRTWKRRERDVAKLLGGQRIPVTGERDGVDVRSPAFVVQVKHGRRRPGYLAQWVRGIRQQATPTQTGIVVWCDNREPLAEALVVMQMADFVALHGQ
jgi:hypothetical protein